MTNPNYVGVSSEVLINQLNDNLDYIEGYDLDEIPKGPAGDYFFDDVWKEAYALRDELKLRGVAIDASSHRPIG